MDEDKKFQEFMTEVEKNSNNELSKLQKELEERVKRHYDVNGWDHARLFGDSRSDYQNYDDWGLDRVNKIITSIGNALSAGTLPSKDVPGSDKAAPSTIKEAKEFLGVFSGDYSLIVARVQAVLSTFVAQFSVASEAKQQSSLQDMPLAGGLHLFTGTSGKTYKGGTFFTNQFIASFQIVFEAYMSVAEAKAIGIQQLLKTTEYEITKLNDEIKAIYELQEQSLKKILAEDPKSYVSSRTLYREMIDIIKADRDKVMLQYDKYKGVEEVVRQYVANGFLSFGIQEVGKGVLEELFSSPWEADVAQRLLLSHS